MRTAVRKLWRRIGRRGTTLLFLFVLDMTYSASLAWPFPEAAQSPTTRYVAAVAPLPMWAVLWAAVGLICSVAAFQHHDKWAFTAATGLKLLWGATFMLGWAFEGLDRGWLAGAVWFAFAAFVYIVSGWPEADTVPPSTGGSHESE